MADGTHHCGRCRDERARAAHGQMMPTSDDAGGIPHLPKLPVFGNLFTIHRSAPVQQLIELARQYGPIFSLDMMGRARRFAGDGLFTAMTDEPNWKKAHNILLPNFSQAAMRRYHGMMAEVAE